MSARGSEKKDGGLGGCFAAALKFQQPLHLQIRFFRRFFSILPQGKKLLVICTFPYLSPFPPYHLLK
jgi:hypothetical protein